MPANAPITRAMTTLWKWATTKYVSWVAKSIGGEARKIPVTPPRKNVTRKPTAEEHGRVELHRPRHIVPIQLKNLIPVGTAMR